MYRVNTIERYSRYKKLIEKNVEEKQAIWSKKNFFLI